MKKPSEYDVIVTTNLFGDILSDLCAGLAGGLGVAPGALFGDNIAAFEPVHGSAPKYAGQDRADPVAEILCVELLMRHLGEKEAAERIFRAVWETIAEKKVVTYDLALPGYTQRPVPPSSCSAMAKEIARKVPEVDLDAPLPRPSGYRQCRRRSPARVVSASVADNLDDDPLRATARRTPVEYLLPRAEVEIPFGDRQHDLVAQEEVLEVRIAVRLAGSVMLVVAGRRQSVGPRLDVLMKPRLVVVHEDRRRDVHRRDEDEPLPDSASADDLADPVGDVHQRAGGVGVHHQILGPARHARARLRG